MQLGPPGRGLAVLKSKARLEAEIIMLRNQLNMLR
jgi:hypothetical protein